MGREGNRKGEEGEREREREREREGNIESKERTREKEGAIPKRYVVRSSCCRGEKWEVRRVGFQCSFGWGNIRKGKKQKVGGVRFRTQPAL